MTVRQTVLVFNHTCHLRISSDGPARRQIQTQLQAGAQVAAACAGGSSYAFEGLHR